MKTILLIVGVTCFSVLSVLGQKTRQTGWQPGMVALTDGTVVSGELNYHFPERLLATLSAEGKQQALSPSQVLYFRFYDEVFKIDRVFASIPVENNAGYASQDFFEILLWGKIAILGKLTFFDHQVLQAGSNQSSEAFQPRWVEYDYYYFTDGQIHPFDHFEKNILPRMKDYKQEVELFVKEKRYSLQELHDQLRIVEYYDQLNPRHRFDLRIFAEKNLASF